MAVGEIYRFVGNSQILRKGALLQMVKDWDEFGVGEFAVMGYSLTQYLKTYEVERVEIVPIAEPKQEVKKVEPPKSPDIKIVYRYVRPLERNDVAGIWEKSQTQGTTLLFVFDYKLRVLTVSWSVCNGDRFEKRIGKISANDNLDKKRKGACFDLSYSASRIQDTNTTHWFYEMVQQHGLTKPYPELKMFLQHYKDSF